MGHQAFFNVCEQWLIVVWASLRQLFTQEEGAGRVLLTSWGALGETWPFFRPNWTKLEALRQMRGADKVQQQ